MTSEQAAQLRDCPFCGGRLWSDTDVSDLSDLYTHHCPTLPGNASRPTFTYIGTFNQLRTVWNGLRLDPRTPSNIVPMDPSSERERAIPTPANSGNPPFAVEFSPIGETVSNEWHTLKIL